MPAVRKNKQGVLKKPPATPSKKNNLVVSGQLEKKIQKQQQRQDKKRGLVFLKHLPHGFFEEQLKNYFEQFGDVTRVRLGRSRRTGGSKGYAFVEFEYPEVAEVAAETMDNYLMFQKVVKAAYIPPEKQIYNYFKTSVRKVKDKTGKEIYVSNKTAAIQRKVKQMSNWSETKYQKRTSRKLEKIKQLNKKYGHLDIDFSKVLLELPKEVEKANKSTAKETSTSRSSSNESNESKKLKKNPELQDLLGNTLNDDDSSDEDFIATHESNDDDTENLNEDSIMNSDDTESSTDEENYGFNNDSDEDEESLVTNVPIRKKGKGSVNYEKSVKASNVDRFEKLIKRKPKTGAVQKAKKTQNLQKPQKPLVAKKVMKSLQMQAAKEILKGQQAKKAKSAGLKTKSAKSKKH